MLQSVCLIYPRIGSQKHQVGLTNQLMTRQGLRALSQAVDGRSRELVNPLTLNSVNGSSLYSEFNQRELFPKRGKRLDRSSIQRAIRPAAESSAGLTCPLF